MLISNYKHHPISNKVKTHAKNTMTSRVLVTSVTPHIQGLRETKLLVLLNTVE